MSGARIAALVVGVICCVFGLISTWQAISDAERPAGAQSRLDDDSPTIVMLGLFNLFVGGILVAVGAGVS